MRDGLIRQTARFALATLFSTAACVAVAEPVRTGVWIDGEKPASGIAVAATIDDLKAQSVELLTSTDAPPSSNEVVDLLRAYYRHGLAGDREAVANLFAPHLRAMFLRQYPTAEPMKQTLAPLRSVHLRDVLYWGDLRFAYIENERKEEPGKISSGFMHMIDCRAKPCVLTTDTRLGQPSGMALMLHWKNGAYSIPKEASTEVPMFPPESEGSSAPITAFLKPAPAAVTDGANAFVKAYAETLTKGDTGGLSAFYQSKVPDSIDVFDGKQIVNYAQAAFVSWFPKRAPWKVQQAYEAGPEFVIGVLVSASEKMPLLLLFSKQGEVLKIADDPSANRFWAALTSVPGYRAMAASAGKTVAAK